MDDHKDEVEVRAPDSRVKIQWPRLSRTKYHILTLWGNMGYSRASLPPTAKGGKSRRDDLGWRDISCDCGEQFHSEILPTEELPKGELAD